jgi:hypothetical protein
MRQYVCRSILEHASDLALQQLQRAPVALFPGQGLPGFPRSWRPRSGARPGSAAPAVGIRASVPVTVVPAVGPPVEILKVVRPAVEWPSLVQATRRGVVTPSVAVAPSAVGVVFLGTVAQAIVAVGRLVVPGAPLMTFPIVVRTVGGALAAPGLLGAARVWSAL